MGEAVYTRVTILVTTPEAHRYLYEIGAQRVLIGRGGDCAIGLAGAEVSRHHAELEVSGNALTIRDLASTNGTVVNDAPIGSAAVTFGAGDIVQIGGFILRHATAEDAASAQFDTMPLVRDADASAETVVASVPAHGAETVVRDDTVVSEEERFNAFVPVVVHERERHLTIREHDQVTTRTLPLHTCTIGRGSANDVMLSDPRTSQAHARLLWQEGEHYVEDLSSTNGTHVNGVLVDTPIRLRDGDVIRIGNATLHYAADDLVGGSANSRRRPVVLIPGLGGSELWMGETCLWPNLRRLLKTPELELLEEWLQPLRVGQMVREPAVIPGLARSDSFARVVTYLVEELGYQPDDDFIEFPYDWRADNAASARHLTERLIAWRTGRSDPSEKVTIIAHSMGGLVARAALNDPVVADACERCIFLGTPHQGSVSALAAVLEGSSALSLRLAFGKVTNLALQLDAFYQLVPTYPCATFEDGQAFSPFEERSWLPASRWSKLDDAARFHESLDRTAASPQTTCIFGYGQKTLEKLVVARDGDRLFRKEEIHTDSGDGIVAERSAVLSAAEIHPIDQHHGALFSDPDVLRRIRYELIER